MVSWGNFVTVASIPVGPGALLVELDDILFKRVGADGSVKGLPVLVDASAALPVISFGGLDGPAVQMDAKGQFTIAWTNSLLAPKGVRVRRYYASGLPAGVAHTLEASAEPSRVAHTPSGRHIASFTGADGLGFSDVFGRLYSELGIAQGPSFRVNTYTANTQGGSDLTVDGAGNFLIAWGSSGQVQGDDIFAQRYAADGSKLGGEFRANAYTQGEQNAPLLVSDTRGDVLVIWGGDGASGAGIYAHYFPAP